MKRPIVLLISAISACGMAYAQSRPDALTPEVRAGEAASPENGKGAQTGSREFSVTLIVTEREAERWLGRSVYGSDGSWLGEIVALRRDPENRVVEIDADVGGFLGIGETRVRIASDQIQEVTPGGLVLKLSETQVENLPEIDAP